jgi:hypothetical protein
MLLTVDRLKVHEACKGLIAEVAANGGRAGYRAWRAHQRARQTANPAAYLLEVQKQLAPEHALARMDRMLGVVSGDKPLY